MTKNIFIYVGPHRSGTAFMRRTVFPQMKGIYDVAQKHPKLIDNLLYIMNDNPLFVDLEQEKKKIEDWLDTIAEENIVISDPEFFGSFEGKQNRDTYFSQSFSDHDLRANILRSLFPNARIILTPRRQDKWIESAYGTFIRGYHSLSFDDFVNPDNAQYGGKDNIFSSKPAVNLRSLDWSVYVHNYFKLFGRDRVLVLPNEMMRHDLELFMERLCKFIGVPSFLPNLGAPQNRSNSQLSYRIARVCNRFVRTPGNRCGIIPDRPYLRYFLERRDKSLLFRGLAGISRRMSLSWFLREVVDKIQYKPAEFMDEQGRREILSKFAEKNHELERAMGIDLEKYGYFDRPS